VPGLDDAVEGLAEALDIGKVQPGGRFVEAAHGCRSLELAQLRGNFHPLRLTLCCGLARNFADYLTPSVGASGS
jgi:hypothetical protein